MDADIAGQASAALAAARAEARSQGSPYCCKMEMTWCAKDMAGWKEASN